MCHFHSSVFGASISIFIILSLWPTPVEPTPMRYEEEAVKGERQQWRRFSVLSMEEWPLLMPLITLIYPIPIMTPMHTIHITIAIDKIRPRSMTRPSAKLSNKINSSGK